MVPRNLSPSSWEAKAGLSEFEANLVYNKFGASQGYAVRILSKGWGGRKENKEIGLGVLFSGRALACLACAGL